jgi:hypothetical protein
VKLTAEIIPFDSNKAIKTAIIIKAAKYKLGLIVRLFIGRICMRQNKFDLFK